MWFDDMEFDPEFVVGINQIIFATYGEYISNEDARDLIFAHIGR